MLLFCTVELYDHASDFSMEDIFRVYMVHIYSATFDCKVTKVKIQTCKLTVPEFVVSYIIHLNCVVTLKFATSTNYQIIMLLLSL